MGCCWLIFGDECAARRFVVKLDVVPSHRLDSSLTVRDGFIENSG
jgi:hypothetical protein